MQGKRSQHTRSIWTAWSVSFTLWGAMLPRVVSNQSKDTPLADQKIPNSFLPACLPPSSSLSHGGTHILKLAGLGKVGLRQPGLRPAWEGPFHPAGLATKLPGWELSTFSRTGGRRLQLAPCPHSYPPPPE